MSPHRIVKTFLLIGATGLVLGSTTPFLLFHEVRAERARAVSCDRHERIDCTPSFLWLLMK